MPDRFEHARPGSGLNFLHSRTGGVRSKKKNPTLSKYEGGEIERS